jgi:hypothetical protein
MLTKLLKKSYVTSTNNFVVNCVLVVAIMLTGLNAAKAQVALNYDLQQQQISATFIPLVPATKTQIFTGVWNDNVATIPIGFNFYFNGVLYTQTNVSSNGFITFGAAPSITNYTPISSTENYAGAIAAFGQNLAVATVVGPVPQLNSVAYELSGTVGNRILKIEWFAFLRTPATPDGTQMRMQIWLYENGSVIEARYSGNPTLTNAQIDGQIGLRGPTNSDFNNLRWDPTIFPNNWPALPLTMAQGTSNTDIVRTRNNVLPATASNRQFRWTPRPCLVPTSITVSAIFSTTATVSWVAPTPAPTTYQYEIRTSGAAGSGASGLVQSGSSVGPLNLTGLTAGTSYTVFIRSDCGGTFSLWSTATTFTTLCNPVNIPYFQYFDDGDYTIPNAPACHSIQNVGLGNLWRTSNATAASNTGQFFDEHLQYDATTGTGGTQAANVWFFTRGLNLTAGTTYRISYIYGGSTESATITNRMLVKLGNYPSDAAMNTGALIANHDNIKASPLTSIVNFTPTTSGVYYLGFRAYSAANNGRIFLDDIEVTAPGCRRPTGLTANSVTFNSALMTWTAPTPAPGSGYAYFLTTANPIRNAGTFVVGANYQILTTGTTNYTLIGASSNAVGTVFTATGVGVGSGTAVLIPSNEQTPTGFTGAGVNLANLTSLSGSTTYYIWVRGNCGSGDLSEWSSMQTFTTLVTPPYCIPASTSQTSHFTNFITTGGIANISNPTGPAPGGYAAYLSQFVSQSPGGTVNFTTGIAGPTVGVAIWVDWNNNGIFDNATERVFNTAAYVSAAAGTFAVPGAQPLGDYRMRIVMDFLATNPNQCSFTGSGEAEDYTFRVVSPPPPLTISLATSTQCAGTNSPVVAITSALSNYNAYSWSPAIGVSGNATTGFTFNSNSSLVYTLTGVQTVAPFATRSVTFSYVANALPTPITITPSTPTVCPSSGVAALLTAAGGVVSGITVAPPSDNFNGATTWTTTNTSTGGNPAAAAFTIRPSGYNPGGASGISSVVSNDASSYFISNSDAQGSGSTTNVSLTSPTFTIPAGYTNASLSLFHYYKPWINGSATIQIFNSVTSTWVTLQSWGSSATTTEQGTSTNFANVTYNLNAYIGMSNIQIRFLYTASWGFVWAIDNVLVSGSAATSINWNSTSSPVANGVAVPGLFTNAAATTAYIAGSNTASVYALPTATTTYNASASTPAPTVCTTSTNVEVVVTSFVTGTAPNQSICNGVAANIVLAGNTGTVLNWQYASDLAFTAPVAIPASASNTLTSNQIGFLTQTRFFRAVVTNGSCTVFSNVITISVISTTWNGTAWSNGTPNSSRMAVFNGNYVSNNLVSPGDLSACTVVVLSGNVNFLGGASPHSLLSENSVKVIGGTLTFQNNASLVQPNDIANAPGSSNGGNEGNITYRRTTTPMLLFDYTYWSSPVAPQTLTALSPATLFDKYFTYNPTVGNWQVVPSNNLMEPGKGYIIRAPQNHVSGTVYNGAFVGIPNNGTITTPIVLGVSELNLIGNPYPSALDAELFLGDSANTGVIDGTIYLWTHNTPIAANNYNPADYAYYNFSGGTGTGVPALGTNNTTPTGRIASGQGFFVEGISNGSAIFTNSMRISGGNENFYRSSATNQASSLSSGLERNRVWLDVFSASGAFKQTLIGYIENATNGYDRGFDGKNLDIGNQVNLYSFVGTTKLGIQGKALPFSDSDIIPLGFKSTVSDSYSISLSNFDGLFTNQNVYLEDKLLNIIHDLKDSAYSFVTNAGTFDDRFQLRFTSNALSNNQVVFNEESIIAYKKNTEIYVATAVTPIKDIAIYDTRGRLLLEANNINSTEFSTLNFVSAQQVVIVKVTNTDGKVVSKKIIY